LFGGTGTGSTSSSDAVTHTRPGVVHAVAHRFVGEQIELLL